ncbi:MAG TPA: hypothetical protein PKD18_23680 [Saprospiraceae bacterium]|nr:hypothetical protein [Saprospiraceae bacterium]HOY13391.1 hypothetical protein [Saprospiraceae bacterium]HPN69242.1 hypothetical protein [Saprospiraceae bacterium]
MKDILLNNDIHQYESSYSDKVWSGVEAALDRERKRRIIVIWFTTIFFVLTILSFVAYIQQTQSTKSSEVKYEFRQNTETDDTPMP